MPESIHYVDVAIRIQFDPTQLPKILKAGRRLTQQNIQIPADDADPENESTRVMTDEEVAEQVSSVQDCIAEILEANPVLDRLGMEITASMVAEEKTATGVDDLPSLELHANQSRNFEGAEVVDSGQEGEDLLDEINDAGLFLCRWPNGDCSVVAAFSKRGAIVQLDEWGAAEPHMFYPLEGCMLDFGLTESGGLRLKEIGEETRSTIYEICYPHLSRVLGSKRLEPLHNAWAADHDKKAARKLLRAAVKSEKNRVWKAGTPSGTAKTDLGRQIQRRLGASSVVADHYADQITEEILEKLDLADEKPN